MWKTKKKEIQINQVEYTGPQFKASPKRPPSSIPIMLSAKRGSNQYHLFFHMELPEIGHQTFPTPNSCFTTEPRKKLIQWFEARSKTNDAIGEDSFNAFCMALPRGWQTKTFMVRRHTTDIAMVAVVTSPGHTALVSLHQQSVFCIR